MELAEQGVHLSREEQARLVAKMLVNICGESKAGTFTTLRELGMLSNRLLGTYAWSS